jgi:hypothetical protein
MAELVLFVEEPSVREMLNGLLPRLLPEDVRYRCVVFEGKQDLEKRLPGKLRAWRAPNAKFVVLRDKDQGDCRAIKARLASLCCAAGRADVLVRIACHELESWYLGDLEAVEYGLGIQGLARQQGKAKYADPDRLANPVQELSRLTADRYQKIAGSRLIGPRMRLSENRSRSFLVFVSGIRRVIGEATPTS